MIEIEKKLQTNEYVSDSLTDKGNGSVNEDSHLMTSNLFGVFDGATGLIKYTDPLGNTGGLLASQIAKDVFERNQDKPLLLSIDETTKELDLKMKDAHINVEDKAVAWSTSASVVRIGNDSIEYIQLGDSPIVFIRKDGTFQKISVDHDLETLILWKKLVQEGVEDPRHDQRIEDQLLSVRRGSNTVYGILNGDPEASKFVLHDNVPKEEIQSILIFSDGMLIPQENPEEPDNIQKIVQIFKDCGLEKVKDYVREIEKTDPKCLKYPRFKQHDDLTAISISLNK